jgi:chorismate lyase/3-hydroxybenzoate synthase
MAVQCIMRTFTDQPRRGRRFALMDLSPHIDRPEPSTDRATNLLPPLRLAYEHISAASALTDSDVLAAIGFGGVPPALDDARYLHVGLEPFAEPAPLEVWRGRGPVEYGRTGEIRWSSNRDYVFARLQTLEAEHGGIAGAARHAYAMLGDWCRANPTRHVLRIWNYLDSINAGEGDDERYRQFCAGRSAGIDGLFGSAFPAATAIGLRHGRGLLQMYWLAARQAGVPMENPRQISAWRYPRSYGPAAPTFTRAMRAPTQPEQIYISGTAAIIGHASRHAGDTLAQLDETLANLDSLLAPTRGNCALRFGPGSVLKVYLRRGEDASTLRGALRDRLGADTPMLILHGDVCRAELLLEIDGVQTL